MIKQFGNSIPGIDELLSFAELMRHVQRHEFDVTVFDTAPTGHTLRLLSLPGMMGTINVPRPEGLPDQLTPVGSTSRWHSDQRLGIAQTYQLGVHTV
jgi:anion-transporting  ArsA/GET3 family ATPase